MTTTTLKQFLNKTGKYFSGAVGILTIDSYIKNLKDNKLLDKYNNELDRNRMLEDKLNNLMENKISQEEIKNKIVDALVSRKESLDIVREDLNSIKEINDNLKNTIGDETRNNLISILNNKLNNLSENISNSNDKLSDVIDLVFKSGGSSEYKFLFVDQITKFISTYQDYLSTLTLMQTGALVHIILSIFILFCLFTIIGIFYGDILIKYFILEEKYPKLAKFIQIRRKFQQYYLLLNILLIFIALLSIIYVNILVFIYL
jgi:hypothetical protein